MGALHNLASSKHLVYYWNDLSSSYNRLDTSVHMSPGLSSAKACRFFSVVTPQSPPFTGQQRSPVFCFRLLSKPGLSLILAVEVKGYRAPIP